MEKLIELLNEYEKENWRNFEVKEIWMTFRNNDLMVISKRYWFIKWLVQNDKIDTKKAKEWEIMLSRNDEENIIWKLSISNTPIEDLISYLK